MPGIILIVDGVSTNRILLKTRLAGAFYKVLQLDCISAMPDLLSKVRPDLILCAMQLPDGSATLLRAELRKSPHTASIPVVGIAPHRDEGARMAALASGLDDVLSQPLNETYLLARIRNLIRAHQGEDELRPRDDTTRALGFAEAQSSFSKQSNIAVICADRISARARAASLRCRITDAVTGYAQCDLDQAMSQPKGHDAFLLDLTGPMTASGLRHIAELRARAGTRHAAIIAICPPGEPELAADALDMGADDVLPIGFEINELTLRLTAQLRRKQRSDQLRATLVHGLQAAVTDPMTGLYNRRYALPYLEKTIQSAKETGSRYAVMLADLDHFKSINDRFGHAVGDKVLIETARRLNNGLRATDMVARIGGEEFLLVLNGLDASAAQKVAENLCRQIAETPIDTGQNGTAVRATISIGMVCGPSLPIGPTGVREGDVDDLARIMLHKADSALYKAKNAGRNQVTRCSSAA